MSTGSFVNNILERSKPAPEITIGMGATEIHWTDRSPYTVVEILSPKKIVVQGDHAKRTDPNGMSDAQSYEYSPNPDAPRVTLTLRKDGKWRRVGDKFTVFAVGYRSQYYDYSF